MRIFALVGLAFGLFFVLSTSAQSDAGFQSDALRGELLPEEPLPAEPRRAIRLTVTPRRVQVGRRVTFRFRATARSSDTIAPPLECRPRATARGAGRGDAPACAASHRRVAVRGALVRFAGKRARTDRRGYARITVRLRRSGLHTARATRSGFRPGSTRVRAVRAVGLTG